MTLLSEEQIKALQTAGMRYPDVNETCIGCSACTAVSDEVFELDDQGKSVVKTCSTYEDKSVDDAISACPVDAPAPQNPPLVASLTDTPPTYVQAHTPKLPDAQSVFFSGTEPMPQPKYSIVKIVKN